MAVYVSGTLAPLGAGPFATNDVQYGLGAWQAFATIAARNAFVSSFPLRCKQGMVALCYDTSPVTLWSLNALGGGWAGDNTDWTELPTGGGGLSAIASHDVLANITGASAVPVANTLSDVIDVALSASAQGTILYRGSSGWSALAPGTNTYVLATQGASANPHWVAPATGGSGASTANTYIVQTTASDCANSQALASLSTGLVKVTATTGVLSTASALDVPSTGLAINSCTSIITVDIPGGSPLTATCDLSVSNWHQITLALTPTPTVIEVTNAGTNQQFTLILIQGGGGNNTVTWFDGITWIDGSPPTLKSAAGQTDVITFKQTGTGAYLGFNTTAGSSAAGASTANTYIVQTTASDCDNAQVLASLSTGLVKVTGTTGVLSTATGADVPSTGLAINSCTSIITVDTPSGSPATVECDLAVSNWHKITLTEATTISLTNVGLNQQFTIILVQGGSGSNSVTWFSGIVWTSGGEPVLEIAPGGQDILVFKQIAPSSYIGFSMSGSSGASVADNFIVQTADGSTDLINAQVLGELSTGLLKVTNTTGVLSTATASDIPNTGLVINQSRSVIVTDTVTAGAVTCDCATNNWHEITVIAPTTVTLSNVGTNQQITLIVNGGSGTNTVTFTGATIVWSGGAPTLDTLDVISLKQRGASMNFIGFAAGQSFA